MKWFYLVAFALAFLASFIRFKFLTETFDRPEGSVLSQSRRVSLRDVKETVTHVPRQFWLITGIIFIFFFGFNVASSFGVTYAVNEIGLKSAEWGLTTSFITMTNAVFATPCLCPPTGMGGLDSWFPHSSQQRRL